jgi:hypothetical protein
MKGLKPNK